MDEMNDLAAHHADQAAWWVEGAESLETQADELEAEARLRRSRAAAWRQIAKREQARAKELRARLSGFEVSHG